MAEAMLAASRLTRRFGGLVAVDDVSIELRSGQIHAVIGTNGAGKSTLINLLAGERTPTSGAISLRGTPLKHARPHRLARLGIGRTFQRSNVFPEFSTLENCRLAKILEALGQRIAGLALEEISAAPVCLVGGGIDFCDPA